MTGPAVPMYIHRVVRTQLYLDEHLHRRLSAMAARLGRTLSDLVRDALERSYGGHATDQRATTLEGIAGLWRDREDLGDTAAYVRRLRRDTRRPRKHDS